MAFFRSYKRNIVVAISMTLLSTVSCALLGNDAIAMERGPAAGSTAQYPDWKQSVTELRGRKLTVPIDGYNTEQMKGSFYQGRVGHIHHAADLLAPRNTPIRAVEDGTIGRLFESVAGGLTIYQKDPSGRFVYYYAHLENYAEGLKDGDAIKRGQVIGYVGTSGNAPANTPHLHFAINVIAPGESVFKGQPIDPYEVYSHSAISQGPLDYKTSAGFHSAEEKSASSLQKITFGKGFLKVENKSIPQPVRSNVERQPAKRQNVMTAPSRMPPLAPPITKVFSANVRTHPISAPPHKISAGSGIKNKNAATRVVAHSAPAKIVIAAGPNAIKIQNVHKETFKLDKKWSKLSKPQKKPVVLRKTNKASTPMRRIGH